MTSRKHLALLGTDLPHCLKVKQLLTEPPVVEQNPVLVVDDEPAICWGFQRALRREGLEVLTAGSAEQGLELARQRQPGLIVLDVRLPGDDGLTALPKFRDILGDIPVIVITAFGDLETAVKAVRAGATDYLTKPFRLEDVIEVLQGVLRKSAWEQQRQASEAVMPSVSQANAWSDNAALIGSSEPMQAVYRQIALVADSDLSVLITGETGTGKELIARAIHEHSKRSQGPYLPIAPVALSAQLIESELFGHVRGAFTGATEDRAGLFELASGGTVLLDEIGDLPESLQVKLLRVLEQKEYHRVGDIRPRTSNARILAATNSDLHTASEQGSFRRDLYYRLAAVQIHAPPLRERVQDIEHLAQYFLAKLGRAPEECQLDGDVLAELQQRSWYGNVRELRNAVEHAAVLSRGHSIRCDHLPEPLPEPVSQQAGQQQVDIGSAVRDWARKTIRDATGPPHDLHEQFLQQGEPALLASVLEATSGNRAAAADILGIHRSTLRERLRKFGLDD